MKKKSGLHKRFFVIPLVLCLLLSGGCVTRPETAESPPGPSPVPGGALLTVDGYGVTEEEFTLFLMEQRALTAAYFGREYGAEIDEGFWNRDFDGQTPNQYARDAALQELLTAKMESILLKERGLADDISYEALKTNMDKTNAENAQKLKTGEVFYGLTEYDASTYYAYVRSQRWGELVRSQPDYSAPTPDALRKVYDENPDYFTSFPVYTCKFVYSDGSEEEVEVSAETVHKEDGLGAELLAALGEINPGDTLPGMSMGGKEGDVTLLSLIPGQPLPFEDSETQALLASIYEESELYTLLRQRVADAKVVIDQARFEQQVLG